MMEIILRGEKPMTKNEQILEYIKNLKIGTKISVRQIAQVMNVSEGTAYKAIKDAEMEQYVSTIPRIGTIRVARVEKSSRDKVTFSDVVNIVEGQLIAGYEGIHENVNKFVIGAMALKDIEKYISKGDLLIVGNRDDVHRLALDCGCGILITGGFSCKEEIKRMAQIKKLPVISTSYDTFTTTTLLHRSIHERLIEKEILLVQDILPHNLYYLNPDQTVQDMKKYIHKIGHSRYPVVDDNLDVVGIITTRDIAGADERELIANCMTPNPITAQANTPVAYISHVMIWEGIEMVPITNGRKLIGVVTRQDVIKGLQHIRTQAHMGEPFEDMLVNQCKVEETERGIKLMGQITPLMLNELGIASAGVIVMLMSTAGSIAIKKQKQLDSVIDSFMIYYIKPLQLESKVEVYADVISMGRKFYKVDVTVYHKQEVVSKAMMSAKILKK